MGLWYCGGPTGGIMCLTQKNSSLGQRSNTLQGRLAKATELTVPQEEGPTNMFFCGLCYSDSHCESNQNSRTI